MPLCAIDDRRLDQATELLIRDGDCDDILTGLYGTVFNQTDHTEILRQSDRANRLIKLIEIYKVKADTLDPLRRVLIEYARQPFIANELDREVTDAEAAAPNQSKLYPLLLQFASQLKKFYRAHFCNFIRPIAHMRQNMSVAESWVDLQISFSSSGETTDDYQTCLQQSLGLGRPVVIVAGAGKGKTTLVKKLANDWSQTGLLGYDFVLCTRLSEAGTGDTIQTIVFAWLQRKLPHLNWPQIRSFFESENLQILIVLDGLDELVCECFELKELLYSVDGIQTAGFDLVITSRPRTAVNIIAPHQSLTIDGFVHRHQQEKCIELLSDKADRKKIKELLLTPQLRGLATTPLLLSYFCLAYKLLNNSDSITDLYEAIIGCLINRYLREKSSSKPTLFEGDWRSCTLLQNLGRLALDKLANVDTSDKCFISELELVVYKIDGELVNVGLLNVDQDFCPIRGLIKIYSFPHKAMQEFFAAYYIFHFICSLTATGSRNEVNAMLLTGSFPEPLHDILTFHNPWQLVEMFQFLLEFTNRTQNSGAIEIVLCLFFSCWSASLEGYSRGLSLSVYADEFWGKYDFRTFYSLRTKCSSDELNERLDELLSALFESHSSFHIRSYLASIEQSQNIVRFGKDLYYFEKMRALFSTSNLDDAMRNVTFRSGSIPEDFAVKHFFCRFDNFADVKEMVGKLKHVEYLRIHIPDNVIENKCSCVLDVGALPSNITRLELCFSGQPRKWNDAHKKNVFLSAIVRPLLRGVRRVQKLIVYGNGENCLVNDLSSSIRSTVLVDSMSRLVLARIKISGDPLDEFCRLVPYCKSLTWIEIAYCHLDKDSLLQLAKACQNKLELFVLVSELCLRKSEVFEKFCELLFEWPILRTLGLNCHMLTDHSIQILATNVLPKLDTLQDLQVNSNVLTQSQKVLLKNANPNIDVLL